MVDINARKKYPSLALGDLLFIYDEDDKLICKKKYFNEECIFIFNLSNEGKNINMIPESDGQWLSLLDRSVLNIENGQTQLLIGPNETKAYYIHE